MTILPNQEPVAAVPKIHLRTCLPLKLDSGGPTIVVNQEKTSVPFLVAARLGAPFGYAIWWEEDGYTLYLPHGEASRAEPLQYFIRFPQEGQPFETVEHMLHYPEVLVAETREFWKEWRPFGSVAWSYPGRAGEFLTCCARNIQQAREIKDDRLATPSSQAMSQ